METAQHSEVWQGKTMGLVLNERYLSQESSSNTDCRRSASLRCVCDDEEEEQERGRRPAPPEPEPGGQTHKWLQKSYKVEMIH